MGPEELKVLLALEIQAVGTQALEGVAAGLEHVAASSWLIAPAAVAAGVALAGIGVAAAVIGEAVKQAADFQVTMTQVANNTNMSDQAMQQMSATVLQMAQTTNAPIQQLADGYMHVANMGFSGADATEVLNAAMESAVSTGGNVADTANVLANVMHEFALNGSQAGQAMDELHTAAALGNMTLEQMTNSFGPVAAIAATIGVPLDQAATAMAAVTRHGFDAAEAGTQVKNMIERLAVPTAGAVKELEALSKATGIDLVDAQKRFGAGTLDLTGYLAQLSKATNGNFQAFSQLMGGAQLTQQQMDALTAATHGDIAALQKLDPNIRGLYGLFILTGRGAGDYADILKQVDASTQGAGITATSFARSQQTLGFQLGVLKNNLQVTAIELGQHFLPQLTQLVGWITGHTKDIEAFGDAIGAKLATAIPQVANFVTTSLIPAVQQFAAFVTNTVVPAVERLWQQFQANVLPAVQQFVGYVQANLLPAARQLGDFITTTLVPVLLTTWGTFNDDILPVLKAVGRFIQDNVLPVVGDLKDKVSDLNDGVKGATGFLKDNQDAMAALVGVLTTGATAVGLLTVGLVVQKAALIASTIATDGLAAAQAALNLVMDANPIGIVIVVLAGLVAGLIYAYNHSQTFRDIVDTAFADVKKAAQEFWAVAKQVTTDVGSFFDQLGTAVNGVLTTIETAITNAKNAIAGLVTAVENIPHPNISIPGFAAGTLSAPGGLALVGEQGPELVNLPAGSQVLPLSGLTASAPSRLGGPAVVVNLNYPLVLNRQGARDLARVISEELAGQVNRAYSTAR